MDFCLPTHTPGHCSILNIIVQFIAKAVNPHSKRAGRQTLCSCILEYLKAPPSFWAHSPIARQETLLSDQPSPTLGELWKRPSGKRAFVCAFERQRENIPLFFSICLFVCTAQEIKDDLFKLMILFPWGENTFLSPQLFLSLMGHFCLQRKQPL